MRRTIRLIEKASIDWNNYLTPEEVHKFKEKDDEVEVAGEIIYDKAFKDRLKAFKKSGWTDEQLIDDLLAFYWNRNLKESETYKPTLTLYHNTSNENAIKIATEGIIPGLRKDVYGKGSEAEGSGVWCSLVRGYGYGGATIAFRISADDEALEKENDIEYMIFREIKPEEITDVDLMISSISSNPLRRDSINSTVESDIPEAIERWGKDHLLKVFTENQNKFVKPYSLEQFKHLVDTGEKYCKGNIYN